MSYYVRLMRKEDIAQVSEIDREAFSSMWPPINYQHELQNHLAHYVVACSKEEMLKKPEAEAAEKCFSRVVSGIKHLFGYNHSDSNKVTTTEPYILGFAGLWTMADEAHIINIAVREYLRRRGIGELLLISMIDLAKELKVRLITLEVRASNTIAQQLYAKYGFAQVGVRRGYYVDNKEDGVIMSTEAITSDSFQARFQQLKQAYSAKWGIADYQIAASY